ncbi:MULTISPECIES: amidohydrolase family protein [unclassified Cobetia]|uniref:amidohydrolase family protein n=1 Tax=unclassified Cobetia TaxID=2609414 RepID=UPI00178CAF48|nr:MULTISPECIES: amidohydrolase family protein [unclassified Cobetia]MBE2169889.1 amidohydrolase family protein [Cobetia sp. 2AS1]MDH2446891.1 amidohydrolase family protein [Cobetia sp. 2AS]
MTVDSLTSCRGVDCHAHVFLHDLPMVEGRRYCPEYDATVDAYLAQLDSQGLSHGLLVQPSFLGTDNRFLLQALAASPERLKGVVVVDSAISMPELDRMEAEGVVGIRLNLIGATPADYLGEEWLSLYRELARRRWHVEIQRSVADLADFLPSLIETGVTLVIDHFGLPKEGELTPGLPDHQRFLTLVSSPQLWVKVSAPYRSGATLEQSRRSLAVLRQAMGNDQRLIWGSDWPHTRFEHVADHAAQTRRMRELLLSPELIEQVMIHNPRRLLQL